MIHLSTKNKIKLDQLIQPLKEKVVLQVVAVAPVIAVTNHGKLYNVRTLKSNFKSIFYIVKIQTLNATNL